jgi:hypothetical protein
MLRGLLISVARASVAGLLVGALLALTATVATADTDPPFPDPAWENAIVWAPVITETRLADGRILQVRAHWTKGDHSGDPYPVRALFALSGERYGRPLAATPWSRTGGVVAADCRTPERCFVHLASTSVHPDVSYQFDPEALRTPPITTPDEWRRCVEHMKPCPQALERYVRRAASPIAVFDGINAWTLEATAMAMGPLLVVSFLLGAFAFPTLGWGGNFRFEIVDWVCLAVAAPVLAPCVLWAAVYLEIGSTPVPLEIALVFSVATLAVSLVVRRLVWRESA